MLKNNRSSIDKEKSPLRRGDKNKLSGLTRQSQKFPQFQFQGLH